jgi:hypothetical protein
MLQVRLLPALQDGRNEKNKGHGMKAIEQLNVAANELEDLRKKIALSKDMDEGKKRRSEKFLHYVEHFLESAAFMSRIYIKLVKKEMENND